MDIIIKLMVYWKVYKEQGLPDDLSGFASWLINQLEKENDPVLKTGNDNIKKELSFNLTKLSAFTDLWTKAAFKTLPIGGYSDFAILQIISLEKSPTKNLIATKLVSEKSTVFESLHRFQQKGLISEISDKRDKRVKRVSLTNEGKKTFKVALSKFSSLSKLLAGDLSNSEKDSLSTTILKLNLFQEQLLTNGNKNQIIEAYRL